MQGLPSRDVGVIGQGFFQGRVAVGVSLGEDDCFVLLSVRRSV